MSPQKWQLDEQKLAAANWANQGTIWFWDQPDQKSQLCHL